MSATDPTPLTPKGADTRQRLFETAIASFRERGFAEASMREIARDAGVTAASLYRYFDSKEAIAAELYGSLLAQWEERSRDMPRGTWAKRTEWLTRVSFEILAPYRDLLRVLASSMLQGDPVVSPVRNPESRRVALPAFDRAVREATDAPGRQRIAQVAELARLTHLGCILFWVMDESEGQERTEELLRQAAALAPLVKLALKTPGVGGQLLTVVATIMRGLEGRAA